MFHTTFRQCCQTFELLQSNINPFRHTGRSDVQHRKIHNGTDCLQVYFRKKKTIAINEFWKMEKDTEKINEILCEKISYNNATDQTWKPIHPFVLLFH